MSTTERRTILVTGATGAQGGSVVRHLLERDSYAVRAFTRNPDSERARALAKQGVEVVAGDLEDADSLRAALDGCYGAFGVTNFWEHFDREAQQGRNLVDAVADAGIRHFVFSTLPNVKALTGGEIEVPHFDIKGEMEGYARERGVPATFAQMAFYYENFYVFLKPQRQEDGSYVIGFPQGDTLLAGVAAEDAGGVIAVMFDRPDEFMGGTQYIVGDDLPAAEYAAIMSRVLDRRVAYQHIPRDVFAGFGFPGAEDVANMFEFYRTRVPNRRADLERSRELYPAIQDFETWLKRHRDAMIAALDA
jgi:uncharacterized protein YbjT (DUF2867 family)